MSYLKYIKWPSIQLCVFCKVALLLPW